MRKPATWIATAGLVAALSGIVAAPAQAADGNFYAREHINQGGRQCYWWGDDQDYRFNSGSGCNSNFNDLTSSVHNNGYNNEYPDVLLFKDIGFQGASVCVPNGAVWNSMPSGWNDAVSSHKWVNC